MLKGVCLVYTIFLQSIRVIIDIANTVIEYETRIFYLTLLSYNDFRGLVEMNIKPIKQILFMSLSSEVNSEFRGLFKVSLSKALKITPCYL